MAVIEKKVYKFYTDKVLFNVESKGKSEKEYFVTGYISTEDKDLVNDVVTRKCMESMVEQIKTGNIKLDVDHETYKKGGDRTTIPVAKIVDAQLDNKGVWIKALINKYSPAFKTVWGSIKKGFLDAFSITYKAIDTTKQVLNGVEIRLLNELKLLNVAITGNPVNPEATMEKIFMKSILDADDSKNLEEDKMTDEEVKKETPVQEEAKPEEQPKEEVSKEDKPEESAEAPAENAEAKACKKKAKKKGDTVKEDLEEDDEDSEKKSLVAQVKSLTEQVSEMKAILEKPQFKSIVEKKVPEPIEKKSKEVDMWDLM